MAKQILPWDNRFCYDLAFDMTGGSKHTLLICEEHGVMPALYEQWKTHPAFRKTVDEYYKEIMDKGLSFRTKAKMQAEVLLDTAYNLVHSENTPAAVKADLIKWTAKVADLEPQTKASAHQSGLFSLEETQHMLKNIDSVELETRVTRIVARRERAQQDLAGNEGLQALEGEIDGDN